MPARFVPLAPPPPPLRLASRPLVGLAAALGAGIAVADAWTLSAADGAAVVAFCVFAAAAYGLLTRQRLVTLRALVVAAAALGGMAGLGALRLASSHSLAPSHVAWAVAPVTPRVPDREAAAPPAVRVEGRVASPPVATRRGVRFALAAHQVDGPAGRRSVKGRVEVTLARPFKLREGQREPIYPSLRLGDRVAVQGVLAPPPRPRNPAQMDYGAYLRGQGTHATLRVESEAEVVFVAPAARLADRLAATVQRHVRQALAATVPHDASRAVLLALLLADRSGIEAVTLDTFRQTGLMHLLAVSGLHVMLVGLALFGLLKPVLGRLGLGHRRTEWTRAAITLALLLVYALVTGATVSVVRAVAMTAVVLVGRALERRVDTLNALGLAAIGLLLWRPAALFEVGFQLSFGAVAALVSLSPVLTDWVPPAWTRPAWGRWLVASVVASTAATLGTAPALLVHFGRVPLAGLVLNAPAIPLTGAALGSALAAAGLHEVAPGVASLIGAFASATTQGLLAVSTWGASGLRWATVAGYLESGWMLAALVVALGAAALARRPVAGRRVALAAAALGVVGVGAGVPDAAPRFDVVFLDVGQGDATVFRLPGGGHVLIDAGVQSPYTDEGARTVVPHLQRYGVQRLDAFVLTHADADHIGGAMAVLRTISVGRLIVNGQAGGTDLWRATLAVADSLGVPVVAVAAGDTLALDPAVQIRVLGPTPGRVAAGDANEASIVLHVRHGATRWLLTGDAEHEGEADLVARYGRLLAADVVKVGHHGSRTSSTADLVRAAGQPRWAVVSVAARNRYGLPDAEPLLRWQQAGATVLQTADEGAVWLRSDGATITRIGWRP